MFSCEFCEMFKNTFSYRTRLVAVSDYMNTNTTRNIIRKLYFLCLAKYFLIIQAGIYLFKVNNVKTRTKSEICSKLKIKTPKRRHWRRSGVFIVNFEQISHIVLFPLLALIE